MLDAVAADGRPVFVSTGGSTFAEVALAIDRLTRGRTAGLVLLHGFQSFPTRIEDSNLRQIAALRARFGIPVGYADHVDGESPMAMALPLMALAAGARVIEKHITLDRRLKGRDYFSALNPDEFARLVTLVREADMALGRSDDTLSKAEIEYRRLMKKTTVARRELKTGHVIADEDLVFRRAPREGVTPIEAASLVGRRVGRPVAANDVLTREDVEA
jgi:sialic acid synthase SpsE